ncbi:radical SAM/SPASM domain-containing protein [Paraliomyxa miuraensis]|uniref:radical SAM/SPASM domain-containing protein n=1 Tax=Paraliomyxa miuraensis TaxID=376150 RepID=UPI00225A44AB|nr:radical SAM protein [Paraliomyxa miuraensis]MCX4247684.1 radical SAM protein [Paraliomyxa miuraensis]
MGRLDEMRRRLPVVDSLPAAGSRRYRASPLDDPDTIEREVPRPTLAVWELTLACDHRCLHCGPRAAKARPDELTTDECLALVDEMAELGVREVVLIGGEAYLRDDFLLVIRQCRLRGMAVTITTGGHGLTPERCEAAKEAGLRGVSVSIDGLEHNHDHVRNRPGSWKRAFEALRNARAAGLPIACNTQINQRTWSELVQLLELIAAEGIYAWQIQFTMAHGGAADHPELLMQPYMLLPVYEEIDRVITRCRELNIKLWPANNVGYFGPMEQRLRFHQTGGRYFSGCKAGIKTLGIESNGQIKSCPSLGGPPNLGGSWREHGLRALWERSPQIAYARRRTLEDLWGYCRQCYYAQTCMAGCTATSEPLLGRPGNNPYCLHRAQEIDRMGMRERLEPVRPAAGVGFDNGLFRLIREPKDPARRNEPGATVIEEPRVDRCEEPLGPGRPIE